MIYIPITSDKRVNYSVGMKILSYFNYVFNTYHRYFAELKLTFVSVFYNFRTYMCTSLYSCRNLHISYYVGINVGM